MKTALTARGLSRAAGTRTLWSDLDFTVESGRSLALTGPSGSGKTTLLRCLSSIARPDAGRILLGGTRIDQLGAKDQREFLRSTCGLVFQDYALVGEWTVTENVCVVRPRGVPKGVLAQRSRDALIRVGLGGRGAEPTSRLSGGEQQRVAVARILVQSPRLVIADEPTAALDDVSAAKVRWALGALREMGAIVVVATHDPVLVDWCDDALALG
ncbi:MULTISPECIES: ABC transporter ATP-binding protein [unclassified Frondihabitans]|uniref:ABC transporter ATP-binding protein n=1 Tax=unclassified Frondihabitans TaxID=2626248 RepID=UPI000F4E42E9|nr:MULTISPECIES: ATP-binding cassette domain-containing protein [unclassified Frondihabitans]RPE76494.1 putative ABC transport system ATP-binding protein [Frondihabitans sp. PhB153]RPF05231.1 putative ABC transport system ATP-binding protein [Frondihabitans sp. PhB161]